MVTTLVDPAAYPAGELLELRLRRWDVGDEPTAPEDHDEHGCAAVQERAGRTQGIAVFCLVYNLVRVVMLEAARRQEVPVARVSFADALKWTRHARPGDTLPELMVNPGGRIAPSHAARTAAQTSML